ncbi:hypothetical protein [Sorangium sp. So ce362]|uniref:PD-(D/E)XK nuclease domain-containing protein n=1 Tax=Sorangium sp. So ce362 TaxID=3133303 RepID=UPI003F625E45
MNRSETIHFSPDNFWSQIREGSERASAIVQRLEEMAHGQMYAGNAEQAVAWHEEESDMLTRELGWVLQRLRIRITLAADLLGATGFANMLAAEWLTFKEPTEVEHLPWLGVLHCPALDFLRDAAQALSSFIPGEAGNLNPETNMRVLLERILEGTGKVLADRGVLPEKEQQVRDTIYSILLHVFPGTVREVPIAQVSKTYRPDIGIRNLKTAIEYKFAQSAADLRTQIGGVYEDIKGYAGSADWTEFIAVFYATEHWLTRHQIDAEWELVGVPHNWKPILVVAPAAPKRAVKNPKKLRKPDDSG